MSSNLPPTIPISPYNPNSYIQGSDALTVSEGDDRYLKLTGGTMSGQLSNVSNILGSKLVMSSNGTVASPSLYWNGDGDTGLYHTTNTISFACSGSNQLTITPSQLVSDNPFLIPNGTSSAPAISFATEIDSGIYLSSTGTMELGVSGSTGFTISRTSNKSYNPMRGPSGSVSTPTYTFTNDTDTGIYTSGDGIFDIAASGANVYSSTYLNTTIPTITNFTNTTQASSTGAGAVVLSGGLAVDKNLWIGNDIYFSNPTRFYIQTDGASTSGAVSGTDYVLIDYVAGANTQQEFWDTSSIESNNFSWTGSTGELLISLSGYYAISLQLYIQTASASPDFTDCSVILLRGGVYTVIADNTINDTAASVIDSHNAVRSTVALITGDKLYTTYSISGGGDVGSCLNSYGDGSSVALAIHKAFFNVLKVG